MKGGGDEAVGSGPLEHPRRSADPLASGQYPPSRYAAAWSENMQKV